MKFFVRAISRYKIRKWATVRIIYRNGSEVIVKVNKLTVQSEGGLITLLEWGGMLPRPVFINVDEILAIYQTK